MLSSIGTHVHIFVIFLIPRVRNIRMNQNKVAQVAPVLGGRGNTGGERDAARQLGLDRDDVRRARKVASLTPEAQETARRVGVST